MNATEEYIPRAAQAARQPRSAAPVDRQPPHSLEAEQGVLGCILWDPVACIPQCLAKFKGWKEWAYDLRHQAIYDAMTALFSAMKPVELISLQQRLKDAGLLDEIGGFAYLSSLYDAVPSAANLSHYLDLVHEKCVRRHFIRTCNSAVANAYAAESDDVRKLIETTQGDLDEMLASGGSQRERHIREIIPNVIDDLEKFHRGRTQLNGLSTGLGYLDKVFLGIGPEDYITLAGRPGDGKSSLAMNIVEHLALRYEWWRDTGEKHPDGNPRMEKRTGIPVAVFSLEMSGESLVKRMMFGNGRADMGTWNTGMSGADDVKKLIAAAGRLGKGNIYINDVSDQTIEQIKSAARRMVQEHGIQLFVLDYIQLLDTEDERLQRDRVRELAKISKAIISLKKSLKVPWLVLAQMNRNIEAAERGAKRVPILSDLKDCGSLEQDADKVALLYRPGDKDKEEDQEMVDEHFADAGWAAKPALINAMVAKNRNGPTGGVKLLFFKNQTRFEDLREWKVANGKVQQARGETIKRVEPDDLPTDEELNA